MRRATTPLASGSISVGLYRRVDVTPDAALRIACDEAKLVEDAGFDGVTFSEHHLGFREYFPNPLLISAFVLERTERIWAGPMPMLLTLRPPALVAEDVAWIAARFPGRVAAGFAAGNRPEEHDLYQGADGDVAARFEKGLRVVAAAVGTHREVAPSLVRADPAVESIRGCVPLVSAGRSETAVRRAAAYGYGILHSPLSSPTEMRRLAESYITAGGAGRRVLIYSVQISGHGTPSGDLGTKAAWTAAGDVEQVIGRLVTLVQASGADALNLRFVQPPNAPDAVRDQIATLGDDERLSILRTALTSTRVAPVADPTRQRGGSGVRT